MKKAWIWLGLVLLLGLGLWKTDAWAAEADLAEGFLDELHLEEIDEAFCGLQEREVFRFTDAVNQLIKGEAPLTWETVGDLLRETVFSYIQEERSMARNILLLITVSAMFMNFVHAFEKSQAADVGFYVMYLCLFTLLMQAFQTMGDLTMGTLDRVITFMELLMPSYFFAAVFAAGSVSGVGFYELTLGMILVIQWILKYVVMPAVYLYVLFLMVNHLTKEDYLSRLAELIKTFVEWLLKTLAAVAIGLQTVQSLILPAIDTLKKTTVSKTVEAIPGVGNLFHGVTEVVIGSAVLIKNAVGAAGLIFLFLLCLIPLLKLGAGALFYRLLAAVSQPVSDERMVACISSVGEGAGLLMKVLLTVGILFFVSVAMATASIKGG